MKKIGFYAGSFDPFTNGHLQIVTKAAKCFDKVIIGIAENSEKEIRIEKNIMKKAIEKTIQDLNLDNVEVAIYSGLTANEAKKHGATILIRGLRNGTDYQYEENIAGINENVFGLDTCYFRAGKLGYISSSTVMELWKNDVDISKFLPKQVLEVLRK